MRTEYAAGMCEKRRMVRILIATTHKVLMESRVRAEEGPLTRLLDVMGRL